MRPSLAYVLGSTIQGALERPTDLTPDQVTDLGQASRALLRTAWDAEARDKRLIGAAITSVVRTFTSDPAGAEELLRRVIDPEQLRAHGHEELPILAREISRLFDVAPDFCAMVYAAAFTYDEASDEETVMSSGVMSLTSNRRQDYDMARYGLTEVYPRFLEREPVAAVDALVPVMRAYAIRRAYGAWHDPDPEKVVRDGDDPALFLPDRSGVWDEQTFRDESELRMLGAFEARLDDLASSNPDDARALVERVLHLEVTAAIWRRAFDVGTRHPETLGSVLAPLAASPVVLRSVDIAEPAIAFCAATFDRLTEEQRAAIENAIISLPETVDADDREREERWRDHLLARLPEAALVTPSARERYAVLNADGRAPGEPPQPYEDDWSEVPWSEREYLKGQGVDVDANDNRRVQAATQPVEEFATTYLNDVPSVDASHDIVPALGALREAIETSSAHDLQTDAAWGHLARAARAISRQPGLGCDDNARTVATQILLVASEHPEPQPRDDDPDSFDDHQSWGSPSPRADAADGLIRLASRPECDRSDLLEAIERLRDDPSVVVRYHVARVIAILGNSEIDTMWSIVDELAGDESTAVCDGLVTSLHRILPVDRPRALRSIRTIYGGIDPERPGATRLRLACVKAVSDVYIVDGDDGARALIDDLIEGLPETVEEVGSIVFRLRETLSDGPVAEPDARTDGMRVRAVDFVGRVLTAAIECARRAGEGQSRRMDEWEEDRVAQWKQAMKLIDRVGMELYFASGAYEATQQPGLTDPTDAQRRLYAESSAIIDGLVDIGAPSIAHHLLETLEHFIDVDPRGVFMRIVGTIRAGRSWGYQYDTMAEGVFVRLVERYLAEHRTMLLQDDECRSALLEILDTFVRAGWQSARRITYGLSDIYR
jgi:hypothetical protein